MTLGGWMIWIIAMAVMLMLLLGVGIAAVAGAIHLPGSRRRKTTDAPEHEAPETTNQAQDQDQRTRSAAISRSAA